MQFGFWCDGNVVVCLAEELLRCETPVAGVGEDPGDEELAEVASAVNVLG